METRWKINHPMSLEGTETDLARKRLSSERRQVGDNDPKVQPTTESPAERARQLQTLEQELTSTTSTDAVYLANLRLRIQQLRALTASQGRPRG
jgi:hypothetical protein